MDDELLASWAGRSPEERESIIKVKDPEIVGLISANMRLLWTAEVQARQFGVLGPIHPSDKSRLPLLSTMEFDTAGGKDGQTPGPVRWPKVFHEDPMVLPSVLRCALPAPGGARRTPTALLRQRWPELLQPPAMSWADFEKQLARLVEQLVLFAFSPGQRNGGFSNAPGEALANHDAGPHGSYSSVPNGLSEPGALPEVGEAAAARAPGGARAAKRARQRERRRMGKAQARGEAVADVEGIEADIATEEQAAPQELQSSLIHDLQARAEQLTLGDFAGAPHLLTELGAAGLPQGAASAPLKLEHREGAVTVAPVPCADDPGTAATDTGEPKAQDGAGIPPPAGDFGQSTRGVGRGRPMAGEAQLPWHGIHGRGMGRGRALAPPPGLQGLQLSGSSQKIPHGLAQPWMPGPAIPEDEDESASPALGWSEPSGQPQLGAWLELPPGVRSLGGERTPSCWASYAPTPVMGYEQTPSPPSTPVPLGLPYPTTGPLSGLFGSPATGRPGFELPAPALAQGVIPMYVTVPIASAHMCPHCGKHFALPSGEEAGEAETGEFKPTDTGQGLVPRDLLH
mmetsp:Transcript_80001/g.249410  ORF Transcript_80001/g.249410 Transcript_80001/m.249410 type:complete len:570 (-) Transcript_80001:127-1836(-)